MQYTLPTCLLALGCSLSLAQNATVPLQIKGHQFIPATTEVPAGQKITLRITNLDSAAEEFDSDDLHREKLVPAGKSVDLPIGPLKPGVYQFKGEFHPGTARGQIVVK